METKVGSLLPPLAFVAALIASAFARADPAASAPANATDIYEKAVTLIKADCPSSSVLEYPGYLPLGPAWEAMAATAWTQNAEMYRVVRSARHVDRGDWTGPMKIDGYGRMNQMRQIANEVGDAAVFQHLKKDDAGAMESILDLLHMAKLLRQDNADKTSNIPTLVGVGIDALTCYKLMLIAPTLSIGDDDKTPNQVAPGTIRLVIGELLSEIDASGVIDKIDEPRERGRFAEVVNRVRAERLMAAVSLACQAQRATTGKWPASLEEAIVGWLPVTPIDPFGDGKQPIGYVVIPKGLPDGSDRPLVYSRMLSTDGMMYRIDEPQYSFYNGDGTTKSAADQKHAGQFRDIAGWVPKQPIDHIDTMRLLP